MNKKEMKEFIEAMKELGDEWTEDKLSSSSYMDMSLEKATEIRTNELKIFAKISEDLNKDLDIDEKVDKYLEEIIYNKGRKIYEQK